MQDNTVQQDIGMNIAISSRVRLARNLSGYPFPARMMPGVGSEIVERVKKALLKSSEVFSKQLRFIELDKLNPIEKQALVEKHMISPELCDGRLNAAVIISNDEKISIMINEEDHLRIQCIFPGLNLDEAWNLCDRLDSLIQEKEDFAYDNRLGYLTCCPTNVGTGLRASVMMHLPALSMSGHISNILEACGKLGIVIRGMYGENSEASGNIYQISNQVTLGQAEGEIMESVNSIARQIISQETLLRQELSKKNRYKFEDVVYRAYGTLANARLLSSEECLKLLSDLRIGIDMNLIEGINSEMINELTYKIHPANLQKLTGRTLNSEERDIKRAELVRNTLKLKRQ